MNVSRIDHVELRCPDLEASSSFFANLLGLIESEHSEGSVSFRCFGERSHRSLVLVRSAKPGLTSVTWRISSTAAADAATTNGRWRRDGEALLAESSDGHRVRLAPEEQAARSNTSHRMLNQPAPVRGLGAEPRRLAHVALVSADVDASAAWWSDRVGLELRERVVDETGTRLATLGVTAQACDLMLLQRPGAPAGALHHVAFAVDQRDALVYAADLFAEHDIRVESGVGQHGVGQFSYVYCIEPSGNRIALVASPLLTVGEEWWPVTWAGDDARRGLHWWGAPLPDSYFET